MATLSARRRANLVSAPDVCELQVPLKGAGQKNLDDAAETCGGGNTPSILEFSLFSGSFRWPIEGPITCAL
jgi:hypothetical protein